MKGYSGQKPLYRGRRRNELWEILDEAFAAVG